jgi:hypothetical protein
MVGLLADMFPGAYFVHMLRDGRRVVHSMINYLGPKGSLPEGLVPGHVPKWATGFDNACIAWRRHVEIAMDFCETSPERCLTVVNEHIAADPERKFRQICEFIGVPFEERMAEYFRVNRSNSSFATDSARGADEQQILEPWQGWTLDQRTTFFRQSGPTLIRTGLATEEELDSLVRAEQGAGPDSPTLKRIPTDQRPRASEKDVSMTSLTPPKRKVRRPKKQKQKQQLKQRNQRLDAKVQRLERRLEEAKDSRFWRLRQLVYIIRKRIRGRAHENQVSPKTRSPKELRKRRAELRAKLTRTRRELREGEARLARLKTEVEVAEVEVEKSGPTRQLTASNMPARWRFTKYIVSEKHGFVYIANPKVASTSILNSLVPLFDFDLNQGQLENLEEGVPIKGVHDLFSGSPYQIDKANFVVGLGDKYHGSFKFAFVRNPWDRLVSCYMSKIVRQGPGLRMGNYGDVALRDDMTFRDFAEAVCQISDDEANVHFRSQHVFVCDDSPGRKILADFVGRFEDLEKDFSYVTKTTGIRAKLPHVVSTAEFKDSPSYRDFYDERLARMVGERYREDAEIFGYSF